MSSADVNGPSPRQTADAPWHRDAGLLAGIWVFMTSTFVVGGAYDTDEFGLAHRVVFWLLVAALVVLQPVLFERALARLMPASVLGGWLSGLGAMLMAVPVVAIEVHLLKFTPLLPRATDPWIEFIPFIGAPVVIVAGFTLFLRFAWERRFLDTEELVAPTPDHGVHLRQGPIGPETLYARSRDHYLEITTDAGRRFVRGRLADLKDQADALGFSPHRSWWVANRAIKTCQRAGRDLQLVLNDGTRVPVSRGQREAVRARGLY